MIIGIISGANDKIPPLPFFARLFNRTTIVSVNSAKNPFCGLAAILPYKTKSLQKMSASKLNRRLCQGYSKLCTLGAEKIVLAKEIKQIISEKNITLPFIPAKNEKQLFFRYVPAALRKTAEKCGINLLEAFICIRDSKMDRITEYLIRELCYDIKNLTVETQNIPRAKVFCDRFFEETGFSVNLSATTPRNFDVLINADNCYFQIGQTLSVSEFDFGYELYGFDVASIDIADFLNSVNTDNLACIYKYI